MGLIFISLITNEVKHFLHILLPFIFYETPTQDFVHFFLFILCIIGVLDIYVCVDIHIDLIILIV